jgi:hypothetical protein
MFGGRLGLSNRVLSDQLGLSNRMQRACDLEEEAGEEVHARDSDDEQPRDLEYRRPEVHHRIVLSSPAHGVRASGS